MKIIKFPTKVNTSELNKLNEPIELLNKSLSLADFVTTRSSLKMIFDQLTPVQAKEYCNPVCWSEGLKWLRIFNITGLAGSPPGSSARVFYECLGIYVFKNTPIEILEEFPNLFLLHCGEWEVKENE